MSRYSVARTIGRHPRAAFAGALLFFVWSVLRLLPGREEDPRLTTASALDVYRFVAAFARRTPADTTCTYLEPFLRDASPGQRAYFSKFNVDRKSLCRAIRRDSAAYLRLASEIGALDTVSEQTRHILDFQGVQLGNRVWTDVYFVVGTGIAAGTTIPGKHPRILIGTERLRSFDRVLWTATHEVAHTQQKYPWRGSFTGGPAILDPLKGTLLRLAITEGVADYYAEELTGTAYHNAYGERHAAELWEEFRRDMHGKDYSRWLYNGADRSTLGDWPPDLGDFIGYSIVKAYVDNARDKGRALEDIMEIHDFDRFLAMSGYDPSAPDGRRGAVTATALLDGR